MPVWRGEGDFLALLKADKDVKRYLSDAEIEANFDLGYHLKHVDTIFKRVFGSGELVKPPLARLATPVLLRHRPSDDASRAPALTAASRAAAPPRDRTGPTRRLGMPTAALTRRATADRRWGRRRAAWSAPPTLPARTALPAAGRLPLPARHGPASCRPRRASSDVAAPSDRSGGAGPR